MLVLKLITKITLTLREDYLYNAGTYLALLPSLVTPNAYSDALAGDINKPLELFQSTVTFDVMPNDQVTFRIEYGFRKANLPYFAGHGGTTSPSGWVNGPTTSTWRPDLQKTENRITLVVNVRL